MRPLTKGSKNLGRKINKKAAIKIKNHLYYTKRNHHPLRVNLMLKKKIDHSSYL
jgi:hypothetical protein